VLKYANTELVIIPSITQTPAPEFGQGLVFVVLPHP
jgi:hypothetical protein